MFIISAETNGPDISEHSCDFYIHFILFYIKSADETTLPAT